MQIIQVFVSLIVLKCSIATKSLHKVDNDELRLEFNNVIRTTLNKSDILAENLSCKHQNVVVDLMLFDKNGDCIDDENHVKASKVKRHVSNQKGPNKAGQKSLLIIFDGTGSMYDDLVQLKNGAKAIIDELAANNNQPIYNYVLVVFRDPSIETPFNTVKSELLLEKLDEIKVYGGNDCPELSLSGIKLALKYALPNSIAFVFSDASARDPRYYNDVLTLVQKTQTTINFLLTGDCKQREKENFLVYERIAKSSNGQVFDMQKNDIKDVLMAIRHSINEKYSDLKAVDEDEAGTKHIEVKVDKSLKELSVSLSGKNPEITVTDPKNETKEGSEQFELDNLKILKFKDPIAGKWNVETKAESSHSVRFSGKSDVVFQFGFGTNVPVIWTETTYQPLIHHKNILSVFVSDPSLVKILSSVTIILYKDKLGDQALKFNLALRKVSDGLYVTELFDVPKQLFKIQINGIDIDDNEIERLLSTAIQAVNESAPEITIEANNKHFYGGENLQLKCLVKSLLPVTIRWHFEDKILKELKSSQSNELELVINGIESSDKGIYSCRATNDIDMVENLVFIEVSYPYVYLHPSQLEVLENSTFTFRCSVSGMRKDENYSIVWMHGDGENLQNDGKTDLTLKNINRTWDLNTVICIVENDYIDIQGSTQMFVLYPPSFPVLFPDSNARNEVEVLYGDSIQITCDAEANPPATFKWSHISPRKNESLVISTDKILNIDTYTVGIHVCTAENRLGSASKTIEIIQKPKNAPDIKMAMKRSNEMENVELSCGCIDCLPLSDFRFIHTSSNMENYVKLSAKKTINSFEYKANISQVNHFTLGEWSCEFKNTLGSDNKTFHVYNPPKIEAFTVQIENDSKILYESGNVTLKEHDNVLMNCIFNDPSAKMFLYMNGDLLLERSYATHQFLEIHELQFIHEGVYRCVVENPVGKVQMDVRLIMEHVPTKDIYDVVHKRVLAGNAITLNCEVYGNPPPIFEWQFNDTDLNIGDKRFSINGSTLTFVATNDHLGMFTCFGINKLGNNFIDFYVEINEAPKILSSEQNMTVRAAKDVQMECKVSGIPQPSIAWTKENSTNILGNKESFIIQNVIMEDSGSYRCLAVNEFGSNQIIHHLSVTEPPKIILNFRNLTFLDKQLKIECASEGNPKPVVSWLFNQSTLENSSVLTLNSSALNGIYTCVSENSVGVDTKSFEILIRKPKFLEEFSDLKTLLEFKEGQSLDLICPFANYQKILWYHNENLLSDQNYLLENKLKIPELTRDSGGNYTCIAVSIENSTFSYDVHVLAIPMFHRSSADAFLVEDDDEITEVVVKVGDVVLLNCSADGYPTPKIFWKKANIIVSSSNVLKIDHVELHQQDVYTCIAENSEGKSKKSFKVDVLSPPVTDQEELRKFQSNLGGHLDLNCKIYANPAPTIFWFKNNNLLNYEGEILNLTNLTSSESATYKCLGKNELGSKAIEYLVNVLETAQVNSISPEIKLILDKDKSATLSCTVRGNPMPVVAWIHNGKALASTSKLNIQKMFAQLTDGKSGISLPKNPFQVSIHSNLHKIGIDGLQLDLVFEKIHNNVAGKYSCYTFNAVGQDEKNTQVLVYEPPHMNPQSSQSNSREVEVLLGFSVILSCAVSGNPEPSIKWIKDGSDLLETSNFLKIEDAKASDGGNYKCEAVNEVGSLTLQYDVKILVPPTFVNHLVAPIWSVDRFHNDKQQEEDGEVDADIIKVLKGESLRLECKIWGVPSLKFFWLKLNYLDQHKTEILDETSEKLNLSNLTKSSTYQCFVNNTVGALKKFFHVQVQFSPVLHDSTELKKVVELHQGVNLECRVDGVPEPAVSWFLNGTKIKPTDSGYFFTSDQQTLRVVSTEHSNIGKYNCLAENSLGKVERAFYVGLFLPTQWSQWEPWSSCSASCGNGMQFRSRICLLPNGSPAKGNDYKCLGENVEVKNCTMLPCATNGGWGKFSKWTDCSAKCVDASTMIRPNKKRYRKCDSPEPAMGGLPCIGSEMEEIECDVDFCAIDGGWSEWSAWSACSMPCGVSHRKRRRFCTNPEPKFNGRPCKGENVEFDQCKMLKCNQGLVKAKSRQYDYDIEEESDEKYKEMAELQLAGTRKVSLGKSRNSYEPKFEYHSHKKEEYAPVNKNSPRINVKVSLETSRPISEETYNYHMGIKKDEPESVEFETNNENIVPMHCDVGFELNSLRTKCVDVDECLDQHICGPFRVCFNIEGSYACDCPPGFKNVHDKCLDINECSFLNGGCSHNCENNRGSFKCLCPENMWLSDDRICVENVGRREVLNDFINTEESCDEGYQMENGTCIDKDECALMASECGDDQMCLNTKGSHVCIPTNCPYEYEAQEDGECHQDCSTFDCSLENLESGEYPYLKSKTIQFVMLSQSYNNIKDHQPILKLINYDFHKFPLPNTVFTIANKNSLFHIEKHSTKRGISYLMVDKKKIIQEKIYKVKIRGKSYQSRDQLTNFKSIIVNFYAY